MKPISEEYYVLQSAPETPNNHTIDPSKFEPKLKIIRENDVWKVFQTETFPNNQSSKDDSPRLKSTPFITGWMVTFYKMLGKDGISISNNFAQLDNILVVLSAGWEQCDP